MTLNEPLVRGDDTPQMMCCGVCSAALVSSDTPQYYVTCPFCNNKNLTRPTPFYVAFGLLVGVGLVAVGAGVVVLVRLLHSSEFSKFSVVEWVSFAAPAGVGAFLSLVSAAALIYCTRIAKPTLEDRAGKPAASPASPPQQYQPPPPKTKVDGLFAAAYAGRLAEIKSLACKGADTTGTSAEGVGALQYAAVGGHADCVRYFLEQGVSPNSRSPKGSYPILEAAYKGHTEVIAVLVEYGADLDVRSPKGLTALSLAINAGHMGPAKFLLEHGADPNACSPHGSCPVLVAAVANRLDFVTLLYQHRANLNTQNAHGMTPLHFAIQNQKPELVRLLVRLGARTDIPEKHGWTPAILARTQNKLRMLQVLEEAEKGNFEDSPVLAANKSPVWVQRITGNSPVPSLRKDKSESPDKTSDASQERTPPQAKPTAITSRDEDEAPNGTPTAQTLPHVDASDSE